MNLHLPMKKKYHIGFLFAFTIFYNRPISTQSLFSLTILLLIFAVKNEKKKLSVEEKF